MLTCELTETMIDAEAFGALEETERDALREHAHECTDCAEIVARGSPLIAALALAAPTAVPAASLKERILTIVAAESAHRRTEKQPAARMVSARSFRIAIGAATAASLVAFGSVVWAGSVAGRVDAQRPSKAASIAVPASPLIDDYAGSGVLPIRPSVMTRLLGSENAPEARGWLYGDPAEDKALFVGYKLPPLTADRAYQLWLVGDSGRVSGGVFRVDPEGYGWLRVQTPKAFSEFHRVGITIEPGAGSPGPTGARVLAGEF